MSDEHFIAGDRPVKVTHAEGRIAFHKYEWETGLLVLGMEYLPRIYFGRGENVPVSADDFDARVAELRQEKRDLREMRAALAPVPKRPRGLSEMKDRARAMEKIVEDLGGDASSLLDVSSTAILCDGLGEAYTALEKIAESQSVVRLLDRHANPLPSGYGDLLLNVQASNGHIAELRLVLRSVSDFWGTHDAIAAIPAAIAEGAARAGRALTIDESAIVLATLGKLQERYRELMSWL
jgi:hypothetical protein